MSRQDAPLYIRAHALARALHQRVGAWPDPQRALLGQALVAEAMALLCGVSLALAFPKSRPDHLEEADQALLRLRVQLRLAQDLGLLSEGAAAALHAELTDTGRMLGGWRKRERLRQKQQPSEEGRLF